MTLSFLVLLYIAFRLKQFACDFLLQTNWMALNKGRPGTQGYKALATHAAVHSWGTLIVVALFIPSLWWLAVVDFFVHGTVDRVKGIITYKMNWDAHHRAFWISLGFDQELHNFTHLFYIVFIVYQLGGIIG